MQYQWFADPNPGTPGDIVFEEYNSLGVCVFRQYDDGSTWTPQTIFDEESISRMELEAQQNQFYSTEGIMILPTMANCSKREYGTLE